MGVFVGDGVSVVPPDVFVGVGVNDGTVGVLVGEDVGARQEVCADAATALGSENAPKWIQPTFAE